MMMVRGLVLALAAWLLAGCGMPKPPADAELRAQRAFEQLQRGDADALIADGGPALQRPGARNLILAMQAIVPKDPPPAGKTIRWQAFYADNGSSRVEVVRLYDYQGPVVITVVTLARASQGAPWLIEGFHVQAATAEDVKAHAFSPWNRTVWHLLVLVLVGLMPLLILGSLLYVVTAPRFAWKWAFALLTLISVVKFTLVWDTGLLNINALSLQLLGSGFVRGGSPLDSWVFSFSLPIGAVIADWRAWRARRQAWLAPSRETPQ
jgi:hypothetical protein